MTIEIERATLSVAELARLLGISENMAYEHLIQGKLPAQKLGKRWIISRNQINTWLESAPAIPIGKRKNGNCN